MSIGKITHWRSFHHIKAHHWWWCWFLLSNDADSSRNYDTY